MKHVNSMLQTLGSLRLRLLLCLILFWTHSALAFQNVVAEPDTYQSAFNGYVAITDESPSDWKTAKQPSRNATHSGHSMPGMQHDMEMEGMADMQPQPTQPMDSLKKDPQKMDHSKMDHTKMAHAEIGHTEMTEMQPASKSDPDMSAMDHQGITHQHDTVAPPMDAMDHSKMTVSPQAGQAVATEPIETTHDAEGEMHEHAKPETPANIKAPLSTSLIIPNWHPAIVHFPIALTAIAFLFSLGARILRNHASAILLIAAGHFTILFSAISAGAAVLFGWIAFNSGMNHDDAGHAAMLLHRNWAMPTAIALVIYAGWDAWKYRIGQAMSMASMIVLLIITGAIAVTGWLGGEVVYRHGIGVLSIPSSQGAGHSHQANGSIMTENSQGDSHAH